MEKVLLINPAQIYYKKTYRKSTQGSIGIPIGLLYIASILEAKKCHVRIIDSLVSENAKVIRDKDYVYYGIPPNLLAEIIKEYKPDIVGISSQFTSQEENVFQTARLVKEINNTILVIVGGTNVSCRASHVIANKDIDIAIKSEGEKTIDELIDFYRGEKKLEEIKGIFYREQTKIIGDENRPYIENLDEVPLPAYHLVDMEKYLMLYKRGIYGRTRGIKRSISIITSRGCPYNCIFCSISLSMGKQWRGHSPEYVIEHIKRLSRIYKVKHIHFEDDNLLYDIRRFKQILSVLRREQITWDTPNGIRIDLSIHEGILEEMKKSGCVSLTIGAESGDEYILNNVVKKKIKIDDVKEFARRCKKVNLPLSAFFILGFPGETKETMHKTINFAMYLARRYGVRIFNLIATPLYGTELYNICKQGDYLSKEVTAKSLSESIVPDGYCLIATDSFSSKDVEYMSRIFTSKILWRLLPKEIIHPFLLIRKIANFYTFRRVIKSLLPF